MTAGVSFSRFFSTTISSSGLDAFRKAEAEYFDRAIRPVLKLGGCPAQTIEQFAAMIKKGDVVITNNHLNPSPGVELPIAGQTILGGRELFEVIKTRTVPQCVFLSDANHFACQNDSKIINTEYFIGPLKSETMPSVLLPRSNRDESVSVRSVGFPLIAVDGSKSSEKLAGVLVHEHQHVLNIQAGITDPYEDEYRATLRGAEFQLRIGVKESKLTILEQASLQGRGAFIMTLTNILATPKIQNVKYEPDPSHG